jgi:hypothetical protein
MTENNLQIDLKESGYGRDFFVGYSDINDEREVQGRSRNDIKQLY